MARVLVDARTARRVSDVQLRSIVDSGAITKVSSKTTLDTLRAWFTSVRAVLFYG